MSIVAAAEDRTISYTVAATPTDTFAITFTFLSNDDIQVYVGGVLTVPATITGAGVKTGMGTREIVLSSAVTNTTVVITGVTVMSRQTDFSNAGVFSASSVDEELDRLFLIAQDLDDGIQQAVRSSVVDDVTGLELPSGVTSASYLTFDGTVLAAEAVVTISGTLNVPGSSTDNALVRWSGAAGDTIQNGQTIEDDSGNVSIAGNLTMGAAKIIGAGGTTRIDKVYADQAHIEGVYDTSQQLVARIEAVASSVNNFLLKPSPTGVDLSLEAEGTDSNINIDVVPKGSGVLRVTDDGTAIRNAIWADTAKAVVTADAIWDAVREVTLVDSATVAVDLSTGINFFLTIGGNRTLANPTNLKKGQSGYIRVKQDATGGRVLTLDTKWNTTAGAGITLSTAPNAEDILFFQCINNSRAVLTIVKDIQ